MKKLWGVVISCLGLLLGVPAHAGSGMLQIKGSDTSINLVQRLAEVYMQQHPEAYVAVTGGGSGTGIAAIMNGKCDITNASREMKSKEIKQATQRGIEVSRVVIAIDGLSVIANHRNTVTQLTLEDVGRIFRGEVTNWSEVGGDNTPITLYGRQSNSGTYGFFQEFVLKGDYSQRMNQMNGNAQIVEGVKQDASGIGYVGVGYVKDAAGVTVLKVASTAGGEYVSPLIPANVKSGKYPISRPLNQYINGKAQGDIKEFLQFEVSEAGQKIVEEEGFFPISEEYSELNKQAGL